MKIKTYKELFWGCVIVFLVLRIVFYFVETISISHLNDTYTYMIAFYLSILQIIVCAIAGFMLRRKASATIIETDDSAKKYRKAIAAFVIATIIFSTVLLEALAMFFIYLDTIIYKITGLHQALFNFPDLWSLSACFVFAFYRKNVTVKVPNQCH